MKIADKSIDEFLEDIATKPCTPAGGCVAALCAASSSALMEMVARHTLRNKEASSEVVDFMEEVVHIAASTRKNFLAYMDKDTEAYMKVIDAKDQEGPMEEYHKDSVRVPFEMAREIFRMIDLIRKTTQDGSEILVTDGVAALLMAKVTLNTLVYHIKFNLNYVKDKKFAGHILAQLSLMADEKMPF